MKSVYIVRKVVGRKESCIGVFGDVVEASNAADFDYYHDRLRKREYTETYIIDRFLVPYDLPLECIPKYLSDYKLWNSRYRIKKVTYYDELPM